MTGRWITWVRKVHGRTAAHLLLDGTMRTACGQNVVGCKPEAADDAERICPRCAARVRNAAKRPGVYKGKVC